MFGRSEPDRSVLGNSQGMNEQQYRTGRKFMVHGKNSESHVT